MKNRKIIIGSRGSKLALIYAEKAREKILKYSKDFGIEEVIIKEIVTKGDQVQDKRLSEVGGKGLFSKTIEVELLEKKIDIAVHALKDMPSEATKGLLTDCFLERNDPREILISKDNKDLKDLASNSIIGTSSFRREFQIKKIRDDLNCKLIRGNVDTRIRKLNENLYDAVILSYAGINSLGLNQNISQIFSTSEIIPCAGQGVIALQCRNDDEDLIELLKSVNHQSTQNSIKTERDVLKVLEGDCETAVGVFARINDNKIDIAIHALKDMPSEETEGLLTNCFLERNDPREILISRDKKYLKDLAPNSIIGTSSYRREFQIKKIRKDLECKLIRGNVDTRIKKLNENLYDAIILSYAGINSLGLDQDISQTFSTTELIPSAGQGVIALQCRSNDEELIELLKKINHQTTHNSIKAERNVLKVLEGDCETAVGVFASIDGDKINLEAELFSLDGSKRFYLKLSENIDKANELGIEMGKTLKKISNNSYKK